MSLSASVSDVFSSQLQQAAEKWPPRRRQASAPGPGSARHWRGRRARHRDCPPAAADLRLGVGLGRPGPPWAGSPPRSAVSEFPRPPRPGSTRPARRQQPGSPAPATAGPGPDCPLPSLRHSKSVLNSNDDHTTRGLERELTDACFSTIYSCNFRKLYIYDCFIGSNSWLYELLEQSPLRHRSIRGLDFAA